jgi:uncharacterized protein (UPF0276 family)
MKRQRIDGKSFGVGLGLRWEFLEEVLEAVRGGTTLPVDFFEVSPENYMRRGGYVPESLEEIAEAVPLLTHGLTMSLGGLDPLGDAYLGELAAFLARFRPPFHSDHLCFQGAEERMTHDLLPLPFLDAAVANTCERIREARDRLGLPIAIENISYYLSPGLEEMSEGEFVSRVVLEADADLLLDVNNVFVNAENHGFDPRAFIDALPLDRVVQIHVAGHERSAEHGCIIDTHGAPTIDPVLELLEHTIRRTGPVPVLLERDHSIPPLDVLLDEVRRVRETCERALASRAGT